MLPQNWHQHKHELNSGEFDHMSREELQRAREIKIQDLETAAAWIAEIEMKLHPDWGMLSAFATSMYAINELATRIADEEARRNG